MKKSSVAATCILVLAGCGGSNPWPEAPATKPLPPATTDVQLSLVSVQSKADLGGVDARGEHVFSAPPAYFWRAQPEWRPVRNPLGIVTGRISSNGPLVEVMRLNGKHGRTVLEGAAPDRCEWKTLEVSQAAQDNSGASYNDDWSVATSGSEKGSIDCAELERLSR